MLLQVPAVVLEWDDLNCHWTSKKKKQKGSKGKGKAGAESGSSSGTKQILHNLTGQASPGRCGGVLSCNVRAAQTARAGWLLT